MTYALARHATSTGAVRRARRRASHGPAEDARGEGVRHPLISGGYVGPRCLEQPGTTNVPLHGGPSVQHGSTAAVAAEIDS